MGKGQRERRKAQGDASQRILGKLMRAPDRLGMGRSGTFRELGIELRPVPPGSTRVDRCRITDGFLPATSSVWDDIPLGSLMSINCTDMRRTFRFYSKTVGAFGNTLWMLLPYPGTEHIGFGSTSKIVVDGKYLDRDHWKYGEDKPTISCVVTTYSEDDTDTIVTLDTSFFMLNTEELRKRIVADALEWQEVEDIFSYSDEVGTIIQAIQDLSRPDVTRKTMMEILSRRWILQTVGFRTNMDLETALSRLNQALESQELPIWNPDVHSRYFPKMRRAVVVFLGLKYHRKKGSFFRRLPLELYCLVFSFSMTFDI